MRHDYFCSFAAVCITVFLISGCQESQPKKIGVVDVEKLFDYSNPAAEYRNHMKEVQGILQKGYNSLEAAWKDAPEETKKAVLTDGYSKLTEQLNIEEAQARNVILGIIQEECDRWRRKHNAEYVINKANFFSYKSEDDITDEILQTLNRREPIFSPLPTVNVIKRESTEPSGKENTKNHRK